MINRNEYVAYRDFEGIFPSGERYYEGKISILNDVLDNLSRFVDLTNKEIIILSQPYDSEFGEIDYEFDGDFEITFGNYE